MESSHVARVRRQSRVRRRVRGTDARPRLSVFRSGRHIYAQVITDQQGHTLLAVSTLLPALRQQGKTATPCAVSRQDSNRNNCRLRARSRAKRGESGEVP